VDGSPRKINGFRRDRQAGPAPLIDGIGGSTSRSVDDRWDI
jgi:hypothetical protein